MTTPGGFDGPALADLPEYLQSDDVVIGGDRYVRLRTAVALLEKATASSRGMRAFTRRRWGWDLGVWSERGESAGQFLDDAFGGLRPDGRA